MRLVLLRILAFSFLMVTVSNVALAQIYMLVKEDGTILYTDKPVPGAVLVNLKQHTNISPALAPRGQLPRNPSNSISEPATNIKVSITSPKHEETIRNNAGEVKVVGSLSERRSGKYKLLLNGTIIDENSTPSFQLKGIDRGAHQLQLQFFDNSGKQLASSEQITFYLHKASAIRP